MRARTTTSIIAMALAVGLGTPGPAAAAAACEHADAAPGTVAATELREATLCLINAERAGRGLRPLEEHSKLRRAATRFSKDMVRRRYFAHVSPSGATPTERIRKTSYLAGARRWKTGENIAAGTGSLATPASIVDAWMESPGHRANILDKDFREIGIGIAYGTPSARGSKVGLTYTTDFGMRLG